MLRSCFKGRHDSNEELSLDDYIYRYGKASEAILYSVLYMPPLVEVDGSILLASAVDITLTRSRFVRARAQTDTEISALERSFNFVEVGYLFPPTGRNASDEEDELLAGYIADAWRGWLRVCYPDRSFEVSVVNAGESGSTIAVQFCERR